jgi:hypothetical protein
MVIQQSCPGVDMDDEPETGALLGLRAGPGIGGSYPPSTGAAVGAARTGLGLIR